MKNFLKIALGVLSSMIPAVAAVEVAVKELRAGQKKKEAVLSIIMSVPEIAEAISSKEIIDEKAFKESISELNDAVVKLMNSVKKEKPVVV